MVSSNAVSAKVRARKEFHPIIQRIVLLLVITFGLSLAAKPASAATSGGGACPSGTYSINNSSGALSSLGITSCFYVSKSAGSDSNNGTSESTPWAHMPGMPSCTGTCASITPAAGEGFILRGGDSWAASDLGVSWTAAGSSSNPMYIGVDQTWYNSATCGASWCRPIFNPASSSMNGSAYFFVNTGSNAANVTVDNIEETGWSCAAMESGNMNGNISPNVEYENLYIHGWRYNSGDTSCQVFAFSANISNGTSLVAGTNVHNNVVDGSDQTPSPVASPTTTDSPVGCALHGDIFANNVCRYIYNINGLFNQVSGNLIEYVLVGNSGDHCNMTNFQGILNGSVGYAFNNEYRHMECSGGLILWLSGNTADGSATYYAFGNVFYDVNNGSAQRISTCTHPSQGSACGTFYVFNNTDSASGGQLAGNGEASPRGTVNLANNHIIGTDTLCENAGVTCNDRGNELYQCAGTGSGCADQNVAAAFNQYIDSQIPYADAPVASTNSTVGAGLNASNTLGLSCTGTLTALCSDTAYATYDTSNHTVVLKAANARGSAWDIGAYQFGTGSGAAAPNPPTGLSAVVN